MKKLEGVSTSNRTTQLKRNDDGKPLDTGFEAWLQCLGSFFLLFNSFGITNSFGTFPGARGNRRADLDSGVFQMYYSQDLLRGKSESDIAWIGSIQASLLIGLGVITGPIFDRGYLRSLMLVGTILIFAGTMITGVCTQLWQMILSQGIVVGIGCGCIFLPSIAILPQYFDKRLSVATGIGSSGSAIGMFMN